MESQQMELNNTCKMDQYIHVVSKESYYVSFYMSALAEYPFTCVCFNETFLHESALSKHPFTCVHFRKTLLHMFAPAKYHPTQLTFQRTLKFPLQVVVVV
jgi:hypothetical protein